MTCQGWWQHGCWLALCLLVMGCRAGAPDIVAPAPSGTGSVEQDDDDPTPTLPAHTERGPHVVTPAAFQASAGQQRWDEELPVPDGLSSGGGGQEEVPLAARPLVLRDVILSVHSSYPLLRSAAQERAIAAGRQLSAQGAFDLNASASSIAAPEGYYENYRSRVVLDQPLFHGGYVYGGYKIGEGNFQPWYKERETNEGGQFSLGLGTPLLKDRAIDKRRSELFQADLARSAVEPAVRAQLLEFVRAASWAYWDWVAAGQALVAQRQLLQNAQDRVEQIEARVAAGDLGRIARINNEQLIAARETKVIETERKLQQSAIKLSLFYRTEQGEPLIPGAEQLPQSFPQQVAPDSDALAADIAVALEASPLLKELDLVSEQYSVELRNAENMMLPKLDALALASKDVGAPTDEKGDKTPFELEAGLYGEIPLQRRQARGKITATQGKLAQLNAKRQFLIDKTVAAVQDAMSAITAAQRRIERAQTNVRLAEQTLDLARLQFEAGDIDLVELNIYEKAVTDAQLLLISAQADFFGALADYRAALAVDPLTAT